MGTKGYTLCAVATGSAYNEMSATSFTATPEDGLPDDYTAFCTLSGAGSVAAYAGASGRLDVYAVPAPGAGFGQPAATQTLAGGFDQLAPLAIGGAPYALGYTASSGVLQFYSISSTTLTALNTFSGSAPATQNLTTIFSFLDWEGSTPSGTYLLCYDMNDGSAAIYQLTAGSSGVAATHVWSPEEAWADGWTRFGHFTCGPENFFIKTNIRHPTVFIDHIMDQASQGTHPARKDLPLPLDLTAVATFTLQGDPCFATYLASDGSVTLNRFRGDLTGWNQGAVLTAVAGGQTAVSLGAADPVLLFY